MIGNGAEKKSNMACTVMAKPEVSIKGMKKAVPHGARPNRT